MRDCQGQKQESERFFLGWLWLATVARRREFNPLPFLLYLIIHYIDRMSIGSLTYSWLFLRWTGWGIEPHTCRHWTRLGLSNPADFLLMRPSGQLSSIFASVSPYKTTSRTLPLYIISAICQEVLWLFLKEFCGTPFAVRNRRKSLISKDLWLAGPGVFALSRCGIRVYVDSEKKRGGTKVPPPIRRCLYWVHPYSTLQGLP